MSAIWPDYESVTLVDADSTRTLSFDPPSGAVETRWYWFRPAEALVSELEGRAFALDALNMRLANLYRLLDAADIGNHYIRGFNVRAERKDPDPPTSMLLLLLGLTYADLGNDNAGYASPATYPIVRPANLRLTRYATWKEVFEKLLIEGHNFADIALHFIPGAVRTISGSSVRVRGSGVYVAQYKDEAGGWHSRNTYRVRDLRDASLRTEIKATLPGIEASLDPLSSSILRERFAVYNIDPKFWVAHTIETNQIEIALRMVRDKDIPLADSGRGNLRRWRLQRHGACVVIDDAVMDIDAYWRPNLGTVGDRDSTLSISASPALLQVYFYLLAAPRPPPPPVATGWPDTIDGRDTEQLGFQLPGAFTRLLNNRPPRSGREAPWIAPVITNRLRAAIWMHRTGKADERLSRKDPIRPPAPYASVGVYDAVLGNGRWVIMPSFFERRMLIRPDGSINLQWLREVYEPFRLGLRTWEAYADYFFTTHTADQLIWYYWNRSGPQHDAWVPPGWAYEIDKVSAVLLATMDDPLDARAATTLEKGPAVPYTAVAPRALPPVTAHLPKPAVPLDRPAPVPAATTTPPPPPPPVTPPAPAPAPAPPSMTTVITPANALDRERESSDWITDTVKPMLRTYNDMVARGWQDNPALKLRFDSLLAYASDLLNSRTPDSNDEARQRVVDVTRRTAEAAGQLTEANALIRTALDAEQAAYKQLRDHALSRAVEDAKDAFYAEQVKDASARGLTNKDFLERVLHKLQASSLDAITRAGQRSPVSAVSSELASIGEWWRSVLVDAERRAKRFDQLAIHSESEALRNEVDRAIDVKNWRQIIWEWPSEPGIAVRSDLTSGWDKVWRDKAGFFVRNQHRINVNSYIERYAELVRRLDATGALTGPNPILATFKRYDGDEIVPGYVPAYAVHPDSALNVLRQQLADTTQTPDQLLDRLRTNHLDCVIGLASNTDEARRAWIEVSERFSACYTRARRLEDYLSALLRVVTSSNGWFSYARRRHWAYDTKDQRSEALPASMLDWHGALVWSSAAVKPSDQGDKESPIKRVSKGELAALEAAQHVWLEAFRSARSVLRSIAGVDVGGLALRFLLCGKAGTIESAWAGLENDKQLLFIARNAFTARLPRPPTVESLLNWFATASGELLGDASPAADQPTVRMTTKSLTAELDALERGVLSKLVTLLPTVTLWGGGVGSPEGWWSASGSWATAYPGQRTTTVLQPRTDQDDDLHGATVALVEFFAYGDNLLWKRFLERPSLKGKARRDDAYDLPRPTTLSIESSALAAAAGRAGTPAAAVLKAWKNVAGVRAMWYTFSRMYSNARELLLDPADPNLPQGDIVPRNDIVRDPVAEGTELVSMLAQELVVLIDSSVLPTAGRTELRLRRDRDPTLARVVERLLTYLDGGSTRMETAKRFGSWVYQSSASGSTAALPDVSRPAQWTQIVYMLSRDEGAMSVVRERLTAEARLASPELVTSLTEVLKSLVNRLEGNVRQQQGTRLDPDRVPPTYPATTDAAHDSPMPRVAWPLAAAQQIAREQSDHGSLLAFFWSTLFRPDTDASKPVPFFTAALPENPDERRTSGFSAQALADYAGASKFATRLFVLDQARRLRMERIWERAGLARTSLLDSLLSGTLRFMFVLDCDKDSIPPGLLKAGDRSTNEGLTYQHLHERAAYCCLRTQDYTPSVSSARSVRWKVLSAWSATTDTPDRNTVPLRHTSDLTGYFNALYPTTASKQHRGGYHARLTTDGRGESLPKESTPMVFSPSELAQICTRATLLFESTALTDWYAQLEALEWPRDQLAILNGTLDTLGAAVVRDSSMDILRPERLDVESKRMRDEWDAFIAAVLRYYNGLPIILGQASVDRHRDELVAKLTAWRAEWEAGLSEKREKALKKLSKLLQRKSIEEIRLREAADKVIVDFVRSVDERDSRDRSGFALALSGLGLEAEKRALITREKAREQLK